MHVINMFVVRSAYCAMSVMKICLFLTALVSIGHSCQPPTPALQFGKSYQEQVNGVPNHANPYNQYNYQVEHQVDYVDPPNDNRVDTYQPPLPNPVASGVRPQANANPIPVPPLSFGQPSSQRASSPPPKDPFSLFGGIAGGSSVGRKCKEDEVHNLEDFLECTEIQPSENTHENAKFGSEKCSFEAGEVCRFYTSPYEVLKFELGRFSTHKNSQVFANKFAMLTQRSVGSIPNNTFMIVSVPIGTNAKSQAILQTDIGCQKGNGKLSFDYWSTYERLIVKVCTRNDYERSCTQNIEYYSATSRVEIDVIHPESDRFLLELIVYGFSSPAAFIVDNLEYEAELCEDDLKANGIQGQVLKARQQNQQARIQATTAPNAIQQGVTAMNQNYISPSQNHIFNNQLLPNSYPVRQQPPVSQNFQETQLPQQVQVQPAVNQNFFQLGQNFQEAIQQFQKQLWPQPTSPQSGQVSQLSSQNQGTYQPSQGAGQGQDQSLGQVQRVQQVQAPQGVQQQPREGYQAQGQRQDLTFGQNQQQLWSSGSSYGPGSQVNTPRRWQNPQNGQDQYGNQQNSYGNRQNLGQNQNSYGPQYVRQPSQGLQSPIIYQNISQPVGLSSNLGSQAQNSLEKAQFLPNFGQNYTQTLQNAKNQAQAQVQTSSYDLNQPQHQAPSSIYAQNQPQNALLASARPENLNFSPNIPQNQAYQQQSWRRWNQNRPFSRLPIQNLPSSRGPQANQQFSIDSLTPREAQALPCPPAEEERQENYQNLTSGNQNVGQSLDRPQNARYPYVERFDSNRSPWHRNPWSIRNQNLGQEQNQVQGRDQYPMPPKFEPQDFGDVGNSSYTQFFGKNPQFTRYQKAFGLPNPGLSKPLTKTDSGSLLPSVSFGRLAIKKMTVCDVLACSFDKNFCHYTQPRFSSKVNHGKWQISHSPIGNRHTGIHKNESSETPAQDHGGFAFVGTDKNEPKQKGRTVYVLESPYFTLNEDSVLNFDLYRRASAITLQVCLNKIENCIYEAPPLNKDIYWRENESVTLPKGTNKVYFVATQWKRFKWLAIDNITINKMRPCHAIPSEEDEEEPENLRLL